MVSKFDPLINEVDEASEIDVQGGLSGKAGGDDEEAILARERPELTDFENSLG